MIRDFDLIRKILLEVQAMPAGVEPFTLSYPGEFEQSVVNEHADLLIQAGLLDGKSLRGTRGIANVAIFGLTWNGHDFIDGAKDETIWQRATGVLKDKGVAITYDVLKEIVKSLALKAAGLGQ